MMLMNVVAETPSVYLALFAPFMFELFLVLQQ